MVWVTCMVLYFDLVALPNLDQLAPPPGLYFGSDTRLHIIAKGLLDQGILTRAAYLSTGMSRPADNLSCPAIYFPQK